jgi:preprotein translocase subunit SecG
MSFVGHEGWLLGYVIGLVVVLVVVALVVPILLLAHRIGGQAQRVNGGLEQAVVNTAPLQELNTTIASATAIVAGLNRGRKRLGG